MKVEILIYCLINFFDLKPKCPVCRKEKIGLAVPLLSDTSLSDIIKIFYMIHQQYSVVIV